MAIDPLNPAPRLQPVSNKDGSLNYDWDRFFYNTYSTVNSLVDTASSSNALVNGTFHFNDGIASEISESDGNGAYVSEKWQVHGASSASYTITPSQYTLDSDVPVHSAYYQDIQVSNYSGGDLYLYQQFNGLHYVRMLQNRDITVSVLCSNNGNNNVALQCGIYRNYDSEDNLALSRAINLQPGLNALAFGISREILSIPTGITSGASPYAQFRLYIKEFVDSCNIALHAIKLEFGRHATALSIDHFSERTRIDNA